MPDRPRGSAPMIESFIPRPGPGRRPSGQLPIATVLAAERANSIWISFGAGPLPFRSW